MSHESKYKKAETTDKKEKAYRFIREEARKSNQERA
jgi:hypothetical protein